MKIVKVTHYAPGWVGGGADRATGVTDALIALGHEVETVAWPTHKPLWADRTRAWWWWRPSRSWARRFAKIGLTSDAVIATYLPVAYWALLAVRTAQRHHPSGHRPVLIYDAENDERRVAAVDNTRKRVNEIGAFEDRIVEIADAIWVPGSLDTASLRARYPVAPIIDVPNGIGELPDTSALNRVTGQAFLYGSWNYGPNVRGIRRLASSPTQIQGTVDVFGTMSEGLQAGLRASASRMQPNVMWRFRGFAPEIATIATSGGSGIVPVWDGGGTKLRTVQLAGMGVPFYATTEAFSGLPDWVAEMGRCYDDPQQLLEAALSASPVSVETRRALRKKVQATFAWRKLIAQALAETPGLRTT
jgi:hypothetical protein